MRSQGHIPPADKVEPLEPFDRLVLTAIDELRGRRHSVNLAARLAEMTGARVLPASLLMSVTSLEKLGLVWSRRAERKTGRDRKGTPYFTITLAGRRALGNSYVRKIPRRRVRAADPDFDFDEVLQDMLEEEHESGSESEPSYDALVRWCGRYPQHSEELAGFAINRAVAWSERE